MIIPGNANTPVGMSWQQTKHIFSLMTQHLPQQYGITWSVNQIWHDINQIERTHIPFYLEHAIAYVGAHASYEYYNLLAASNQSIYAQSVLTGYHLAMAVFCEMPGHVICTLPELADDLAFTLQRETRMPAVVINILRSVQVNIVKGYYRDIQKIRTELIRYIDSIMNGNFSNETKTAAVQACCFILMHFH